MRDREGKQKRCQEVKEDVKVEWKRLGLNIARQALH